MKKILVSFCLVLAFSFALVSPVKVQAASVDNSALIQQLLSILLDLQKQLMVLIQQQGNNNGGTNSDLKLNSPTFAADGSVHFNAAVDSVHSAQTNALTSVTLRFDCPNGVGAIPSADGYGKDACNSTVNMDQIGEWGTYQKVFKFNNVSGSNQTVTFTATSKPSMATKSASIVIPWNGNNNSTQTQPKSTLSVMNSNGGDSFNSTDRLSLAISNPVYNTTYNAVLMYGEKTVAQLGQVTINYQTDIYKTLFSIPQISAYLGSYYNVVLYPYISGDTLTSNYFSIIPQQTNYAPNIDSVGAPAEPTSSFAPGDHVTIVGSNFPQNPTIGIGSTFVAGQTNSGGTNITFTAPSMPAGNYNLYISVKGGSNNVPVTVLSR